MQCLVLFIYRPIYIYIFNALTYNRSIISLVQGIHVRCGPDRDADEQHQDVECGDCSCGEVAQGTEV